MLRKIKSTLPIQDYKRLYLIGSYPGKFYGTAKLHKIKLDGHVDHLLIRPIESNIGTATYNLSKYLAKMLEPQRKSQYSLKTTKDFMYKIKTEKIPTGYQMVSFDVKSLFTNLLLDRTINIILQLIFDNQEIQTTMTKKELEELLILCTKNVHLTFSGKTFVQYDGAAMGSQLGSVLVDIFMVELQNRLVPT